MRCQGWLALLLVLTAASAHGLAPMSPQLEKQLRARGALAAVAEQLQGARERGVFAMEHTRALPTGPQKRVTNWRGLVLLVDFPDYPATGNFDAADFHQLLFSDHAYPTGSMRDFYMETSYGNFVFTGDVVGWYTMPENYSYYANYDGVPSSDDFGFGSYPHNAEKLYEHAVAAADPFVDFSLYLNGGGSVDGLFIVHAGPGGEATGNPNHIWSHRSEFTASTADGVAVGSYTFQPETLYGGMSTMGVYAHEFGHSLGLPDLYDTDYSSGGIGYWSLMSHGSWNNNGATPALLDVWCKVRLGFVDPIQVTGPLVGVTIPSAHANPVAYRLKTSAHGGGESLLIENRRRVGFDSALPAQGLLAWHIDSSQQFNSNESCGANPIHPIVRLIQADDLCQIETGWSYGDSGDPFPGSTNKTTLNALSTPNSRAYSGKKSGVKLSSIALVGNDVVLDIQLDEALIYTVPTQFSTLEAAITVSGADDQIRLQSSYVASGPHTLTTPITISGGWNADFTVQDPQAKTLLQGTGSLEPLLRIVGSASGPQRLVNLRLEGGGGHQIYTPSSEWQGGAIHMENGALEIVDCSFTGSSAGPNSSAPVRGGAMALLNVTAQADNCSFGGNLAKEGGEIFVAAGSLLLRDCQFSGGVLYVPPIPQSQFGGAIHAALGAELTLEDCTVDAYDGADRGGAIYAHSSTLTLTRSIIDGSQADAEGGGIYVENGSLLASQSEVRNASCASLGGGIYTTGSLVQWDGGRIGDNSTTSLGAGGYLLNPSANSRLRSVRVDSNATAIIGGGLIVSGGSILIEHCLFHANSAGLGAAGALQIANATATFRHNIVHASVGGGVYWSGAGSNSHNLYWATNPGADFTGATLGPGSFTIDPLFVNAPAGDFHLGGGSPAIDAGDANVSVDFDGSAPDLGIYGGSLDDGDRPATALNVQATPEIGSLLLSWSFPTPGTAAVQSRVYGAMETSLPKAGLGNEFLLGVVTAPLASWNDTSGSNVFEVQLVDAAGRAGAYAKRDLIVDAAPPSPSVFALGEPTPNPFNPRTSIELQLPKSARVLAEIFDARGRRVRRLLDDVLPAGALRLHWDGCDDSHRPAASGSYMLRVETALGDATRRLLLLK